MFLHVKIQENIISNNIGPLASLVKIQKHIQRKLFILSLFIKVKIFTRSDVFAQMYQFSLHLSSLQQKFSLTSNYLGTNTVIVKRIHCSSIVSLA